MLKQTSLCNCHCGIWLHKKSKTEEAKAQLLCAICCKAQIWGKSGSEFSTLLKMTPCCIADRWPDIIHPDRFFPVFSSKCTTLHWTDRALLLAICLPCLSAEHVLPVWDLSCWGHHWLLTLTLLSKTAYYMTSYSYIFQSRHLKLGRKTTLLLGRFIWEFPKIVLFQAEIILSLWVMQKECLNQDWAVVRCLLY